MNYYEHHLGDWAAATGHLSWDEDMAYTRLLRAYYHHEQAIAEGQQYRLAKAATPAQRKAVDQVLLEFFDLRDGRYHQKRADAEIARFRDKQEKAKRSAEARWSGRKPQSFGNANASPDAMRTHTDGNALQTPDTRHQSSYTNTSSVGKVVVGGAGEGEPDPKQDARKRASSPPKRPDDVDEHVWQDWIALRKSKKAAVSETVLRAARREADKAGMTLTNFLVLWCLRGSQGLQADWIKPQERSALGQQIETFRERDERLARKRYEELTGRVHPDNLPQQPVPMADVIDITPARALLAKGAL